jgi:serine/threonine-protein kinase
MGVVYRARQQSLNRIVALKMLPAGADKEAMARFCVEGKAVAGLRHPGVVEIFELGEHDGRLYFSMEYLGGGTLAKKLADGPLAQREAAGLVAALARAVQAAHEAEVVHRDLKPSNVLLAADGTPKIADFGLAKLLDEASAVHTHTHAVVGTAAYMAPEQAAGNPKAIGPAADVYALGAILYQCLVGQPPFIGTSRARILDQVQKAAPERPSRLRRGLSRELEAVCLKCLEKNQRNRYRTAADLAEDLRRWLEGRLTLARPPGRVTQAMRQVRRHPVWSVVVVLILLLAAAWSRLNPDRPRKQVEATLARGETVTLIGETGAPRWFRWTEGQENSSIHLLADGTFSLLTGGVAMVELVADPRADRYRLRAQVRHHRASNLSDVGLFVVHSSLATSLGAVHCYGELTFDDVTLPRGTRTAAILYPHLLPVAEPDNTWDCRARGVRSPQFAAAGVDGGPWHDLAVEVTPEGLRGFWDAKLMGEIPAAQFVQFSRDAMKNIAADSPGDVYLRELQPEYATRKPLGLYVYRGFASFRNVVIEPLASTP